MGGMAVSSSAMPAPVDPSQLTMRIVGWAALFVMAAGFAAAETAITTLWPWKIKKILQEEGPQSSFSMLQDDISRVLTTLLIGVTICTVYSTALATLIITQVFGPNSLNVATFALTMLTLIFAEILPKTVAVSRAETIARLSMPLINALTTLLKPVSVVSTGITTVLTSIMGVQEEEEGGEGAVSQPELKLMLMGAMKSGSIADYEVEMIEGVLDMEKKQVKEVMKPRVDVVGIDANATVRELFDIIDASKYSRIPVYEENIDNIIGVSRAQSLLTYARDTWTGDGCNTREEKSVAELMEPTDFIPQTMPVMSALKEMRKRRLHMLIVVDEYGGTAGIVTLEDILEELVGDIYDEADDEQYQEEERQIVTNADGSFIIDGMADLEEACEALGMAVSVDELREFGTLSGYLCHQAGEIPEAGDEIVAAMCKFVIQDCDERKIKRVYAVRLQADDVEADASAENGSSSSARRTGTEEDI